MADLQAQLQAGLWAPLRSSPRFQLIGWLVVLTFHPARMMAQDESRWTTVLADSAEAISIDTASIRPLGGSTYRVWERAVALPSGRVRALARAEFDCRTGLTRAVAVVLPGFQPIDLAADDRRWVEILPESPYEAELRWVCSRGESPSPPP